MTIEWLTDVRKSLTLKLFDLQLEKRFQDRQLILNPNVSLTINNQYVGLAGYVNMLKKDIENIEQRLKLVEDIFEEKNTTVKFLEPVLTK